jgi:hypothetical protein
MTPVAAGTRAPTLVSVVIPLRNGGEWIGDQLEALAAQDYRGAWEVVVVDNGSTDRGPRVARSFAPRLPGLHVVDAGGRRGINHARNVGVRAARGDLLLFCDADDVVAAGWIGAMVEAAAGSDVVGGRLRWDLLNDEHVLARHPVGEMTGLSVAHDYLPYPAGGNLAVWATVARELGWDERFPYGSSDQEFGWRAQLAGFRVSFAACGVVQQRFRAGVLALAWQQFRHGMSGPALVRAFGDRGVPGPDNRAAVERWRWLLVHAGHLWRSDRLRGEWIRRASFRAGRLAGSVRHRTLCL